MEHYFTKKPSAPIRERTFDALIEGVRCVFSSGASVFSKARIDPGSHLLIETGMRQGLAGKSLLDLGCGFGAVGIFLKKKHPSCSITFSDVNGRALMFTKKNLVQNRIDRESASTLLSNGFERIPGKFDFILTNPPQHAGRKVCIRLIEESAMHLNSGGMFLLVARHNRGGSTLSGIMNEKFGNAESIAKSGVFRVYASVKKE